MTNKFIGVCSCHDLYRSDKQPMSENEISGLGPSSFPPSVFGLGCRIARFGYLLLIWSLVSVLLSPAAVLLGCSSGQGLNPGDSAPQFSLPIVAGTFGDKAEGDTLALSSLQGKVVILNFLASWCAPCLAELPALERLAIAGRSREIVVLGIGVDDDQAALRDAIQRSGVRFPVVLDTAGKVKSSFRISGVPETFILDRQLRFVMYPDPERGPILRIVGPQEWDSGPIRKFLFSLGGV